MIGVHGPPFGSVHRGRVREGGVLVQVGPGHRERKAPPALARCRVRAEVAADGRCRRTGAARWLNVRDPPDVPVGGVPAAVLADVAVVAAGPDQIADAGGCSRQTG
jgi:hypothetical protein